MLDRYYILAFMLLIIGTFVIGLVIGQLELLEKEGKPLVRVPPEKGVHSFPCQLPVCHRQNTSL